MAVGQHITWVWKYNTRIHTNNNSCITVDYQFKSGERIFTIRWFWIFTLWRYGDNCIWAIMFCMCNFSFSIYTQVRIYENILLQMSIFIFFSGFMSNKFCITATLGENFCRNGKKRLFIRVTLCSNKLYTFVSSLSTCFVSTGVIFLVFGSERMLKLLDIS